MPPTRNRLPGGTLPAFRSAESCAARSFSARRFLARSANTWRRMTDAVALKSSSSLNWSGRWLARRTKASLTITVGWRVTSGGFVFM